LRGRILVVRGGAIGDFILTVPAITALRSQFPEAHIEVLGYPHIAQLASAAGLVDRVQSIDARALAGFFARGGALSADLADYFSDFDLVLSYLYDPDGIFQTNVALCTSAQFIQGAHRPDETLGLHATQVFLKPLERLAIFDADAHPRLAFAGVTTKFNRIALHPGSGSELKNWPEERWAELMVYITNSTDSGILLIGGEAEGERIERLSTPFAHRPGNVSVAKDLPLPELGRLLEGCRGFIGHDSGISHLAGAVGLPGVLLWGESNAEVWRPLSERMVLLRNPGGLPGLDVAQVIQALKNLIQQEV
jgi:heptosyltransferase-2